MGRENPLVTRVVTSGWDDRWQPPAGHRKISHNSTPSPGKEPPSSPNGPSGTTARTRRGLPNLRADHHRPGPGLTEGTLPLLLEQQAAPLPEQQPGPTGGKLGPTAPSPRWLGAERNRSCSCVPRCSVRTDAWSGSSPARLPVPKTTWRGHRFRIKALTNRGVTSRTRLTPPAARNGSRTAPCPFAPRRRSARKRISQRTLGGSRPGPSRPPSAPPRGIRPCRSGRG